MKKLLCLILAIAMVLGTMSTVVFAADDVATINGVGYSTVQDALDAAVDGDTIELAATTIDEDILILQKVNKVGRSIKLSGVEDGTIFTGKIIIDGQGYKKASDTETLTIENIKFDFSGATTNGDIISSPKKQTNTQTAEYYDYAHNVTIQNCEFIGSENADIVAVRFTTDNSYVISNCTGTKLHSLLQNSALMNDAEVLIENCTVTDSSGGLNIGTHPQFTIRNTYIELSEDATEGYAVRMDLNGNASTPVIEGCTFIANTPVVLRKEAKNDCDLTIVESKIVSTDNSASITRSEAVAGEVGAITLDIDRNYWGGGAATFEALDGYSSEVYYIDEEMETLKVADSSDVVAIIGTEKYTTLQAAVDAAVEGDNTITLLADCDEDVTVTQNEGINITLDGADNDFTGTIYIHGRARHTGSETLTIQNFNFTTEEDAHDFISSNSTGETERYAHNVTIVDCDFTATEESTAVVATRFRQAYNIVMENCTATNLHSAMWATGGTNVDVTGLTATNCKEGGLSFGTTTPATVTNSTITAADENLGYGIRVDGSSGAELTVEGCTIDAFVPVIMRNATSADNAVTVTNSELTASNPYGYEVGVVKTDYLKATDTFTPADVSIDLVIDDSYAVSTGVWDGVSVDTSWYNTTDKEFTITSAAAFAGFAAIANGTADGIAADTFKGKTVKLGVDIDLGNYKWAPIGGRTSLSLTGQIECTFDGQGHTISNLKVEKGSEYATPNMNIGLFGITRTGSFVAKNFTLKNVDIYGNGSAAAVLGRTINCKAVIDNVDVIGDIKIEASNINVGAICAEAYMPVITNCNVIGNDGSYIKAGTKQVGGILGWSGESANATTVTDCSVENVTISAPEYVGAIAAIIQYGATVKNNTVENVTLNVLEGAENNEYHYGTIIGSTGAGYVANNGKNTLPVYISGNTTENVNVALNGEAVENPVEFGAHYDGTSYVSARIGDAYYESLQVAINAAQTGDTITLINDVVISKKHSIDGKDISLDLAGYTISGEATSQEACLFIIANDAKLTIVDSSEDESGKVTLAVGSSNVGYAFDVEGALVLESGTIETSGDWAIGFCVDVRPNAWGKAYSNPTTFVMNGGKLVSSDAAVRVASSSSPIYTDVSAAFTFNDGVIEADSDGIFVQQSDADWDVLSATINGGSIVAGTPIRIYGPTATSFVNGEDCIDIEITSGSFASTKAANYTWLIDSLLRVSGGVTAEDVLKSTDITISGGTFTGNVSEYVADGFDLYRTANGYVVVDEEFEDTAEEINVVYKDVTPEGTEGKKVYEIVVKANDGEEINELASVDLSFEFTKRPIENGNIDITVLPAKDFAMTRYEDADRYMFNYNGVNAYEGKANAIPVGTITVEGYGSFSIATAQAGTNVVNATTLADNLVDSYTTDGAEDKDLTTGALVINESIDNEYVGTVGETTIAVPVRDLAIDIAFKNAVENQSKAYQDMKVVISGGDLAENIEIELGSDAQEVLDLAGKADAAVEVAYANNAYTVAVTDALTYNRAYTVTVSGAGYRTARYTVTMTKDKELSFWNNVMDNNTAVEEGEFETTKTFLAGDIVKDNNINIYDLSAVVSYFGTDGINTQDVSDYAKYDLDRNGVIDSRDVAYVLVSWGE